MTQAQVPPVVALYMRAVGEPYDSPYRDHPIIAQVFRPGVGWRRYAFNKRVSASWVAKHLIPHGVTDVALRWPSGRVADFTTAELMSRRGLRTARPPRVSWLDGEPVAGRSWPTEPPIMGAPR